MKRNHLGLVLALACVLLAGGCGKKREPTFDVSGKVTFNGKPVPRGQIVFNPDPENGNRSRQSGYAEIQDGAFDTRKSGIKSPAGPVIVRIEGFDGKPDGKTQFGNPLFVDYSEKIELPAEHCQRDFDVPGEAAKKVGKVYSAN
jgi:hypothetical protein